MIHLPGIQFSFGTRLEPRPDFVSTNAWEKRAQWKQVHGVKIAYVTHPEQACGEVDGLWTKIKKFPVAVVSADCVPILLTRKDRQAVAALHSGWRGTQARIPEVFFQTLPNELNRPSDWIALIGPSIKACCYEVSEELIQNFVMTFSDLPRNVIEPSLRKLDLTAVTKHELERLGVEVAWIHSDCTLCTSGKYFSYRGGDRKSRQYSVIQLD